MVVLYHERQEAALCGQHCLNNLLQGPYFSSAQLSSIALELDAAERQLMLAEGMTPEAEQFIRAGSNNVADDGNFSVQVGTDSAAGQVLAQALKRGHGLSLEDTRNSAYRDAVARPEKEQGFILNRHSHWYCLRKVHGEWWRLNSTEDNPEKLSEFTLGATIANLIADSWHIFVVRGTLPPPISRDASIAPYENWVDTSKPRASSIADFAQPNAAKEPKFQAFTGAGQKLGGGGSDGGAGPMSEDEQLALALALSQEVAASHRLEAQLPAEPASGGARVQVRMPDGQRVQRRFVEDSTLQTLVDFVCVQLAAKSGQYHSASRRWQLTSQYPPLKLSFSSDGTAGDSSQVLRTMRDAGLVPSAQIFVAAV